MVKLHVDMMAFVMFCSLVWRGEMTGRAKLETGNLEVIKPGEAPIVLALEPIMVALILTSAVSGKPLRVKEAIALCNEVLQSHDEMKAKVIAWKQGRGIHNPNGWLLINIRTMQFLDIMLLLRLLLLPSLVDGR